MTLNEMIEQLTAFQRAGFGEKKVMVLDSHNGGGSPRDVNLGPNIHTVTFQEAEETADCEDVMGEHVIIMGFGCY
jgi:hypothetical protein